MKEGQDLVVAGYAGMAGSRRIAASLKSQLEPRFSRSYLDRLVKYRDPAEGFLSQKDWKPFEITACEPCGEGGILTAVWNLSGTYRIGVEFSLRRIPIRQGTIEICEWLGLNPYRLYSAGCWLLVSDNGGRLAGRLAQQGIAAGVIGCATKGIARVIMDGEEKGYLNRPQPDELERVIPDWKALEKSDLIDLGGSHEREDFGSD